jgi:hypothetical protein
MLDIIIDTHVSHEPIKEEAVKANFAPCLVYRQPSCGVKTASPSAVTSLESYQLVHRLTRRPFAPL